MTIEEIKQEVNSSSYNFLRTNKHLGKNMILLGLGGSYAYGTNNENSDIDVRGIATLSKSEILTGKDFEQVTNNETDTTIYSFNKIIKLLTNCNPNVIEMLGLKPEHYIIETALGQALIENKTMFLSQKAFNTFGGYATAQFKRMENKCNRVVSQEDQEKHILKTINNASEEFSRMFCETPKESIKLYIDKSNHPDFDTEIFCDINLKHYPLRDHKGMMMEMGQIISSYDKIGHRNAHAIENDKLGKHMMHLVRLYLMCFDILEKGEINTYREKEHDFLMDIRNGKYLDENKQPIPEFYELVKEYEKRLEYDKNNTFLPKEPDYKRINEFVESVNGVVVRRI